jgi:hypothetical protein
MQYLIRYPLTEFGVKQMKCGRFVAVSRFQDSAGFAIAYPQKNPMGFQGKSLMMEDMKQVRYGFVMEKPSPLHTYQHFRTQGKMPRKMKKRLCGTLSRYRRAHGQG